MSRKANAESHIPEIRFRPTPDVYAKAALAAQRLGLTVTDMARIGLAQVAHASEIPLVPYTPAQRSVRELPIHGVTAGRVADIATEAARAAYRSHVHAGRLPDADQS